MRRTIKAFGVATFASLAFGAFVTSAAQAGHTWEVGGTNLADKASSTCLSTSDGTFTFQAVKTGGEVTFHITSTAVATTGCKITQVGSGATAEATGSIEKISFSGLTVDKPEGCGVKSPIDSVPIKSKIVTVGGVAYTTFVPQAGTTFFNIVITGCADAETYPVKGSVCAEMPQAGVLTGAETIKFSAAADTACPEDKVTMGGMAAILRGGIVLELSGPDAGKTWGFTAT